jgi:hypothetical protein
MVLPSAEMARPWFSCEKMLDFAPGGVNNQSPRWRTEIPPGRPRANRVGVSYRLGHKGSMRSDTEACPAIVLQSEGRDASVAILLLNNKEVAGFVELYRSW